MSRSEMSGRRARQWERYRRQLRVDKALAHLDSLDPEDERFPDWLVELSAALHAQDEKGEGRKVAEYRLVCSNNLIKGETAR